MKTIAASSLALVVVTVVAASTQEGTSDLAKQLSNPIASLISRPFQFNYDSGYGPYDGDKAYQHTACHPVHAERGLEPYIATGVRYWAENTENGPGGFGFRNGLAFLFPK